MDVSNAHGKMEIICKVHPVDRVVTVARHPVGFENPKLGHEFILRPTTTASASLILG